MLPWGCRRTITSRSERWKTTASEMARRGREPGTSTSTSNDAALRGALGADGDGCSETLQQPEPIEHVFQPRRESPRSDGAVKPHRQHVLPVHGANAEMRSREGAVHGAAREDAVARASEQPPDPRVNERGARSRRIVEDDQPIGDPARFAEAL